MGAKGPVKVPPAPHPLVGDREVHSFVKLRFERFIESLLLLFYSYIPLYILVVVIGMLDEI